MTITVKAKGRHGDWAAEIDGDAIPCVHSHWFAGRRYNDVELRLDDPKHARFVENIREVGKVIVCKDEVTKRPDTPTEFRRLDYIGFWSVANVEFDAEGLRFDLVERIADVRK